MLEVHDAIARILGAVVPLASEERSLADAHGRVLVHDVHSPLALPPWDNAAMDGYAARTEDFRGASRAAPATLVVVGTVRAGALPAREVGPGEAMRIATGAPLPAGADCVVRVEDTDRGAERVTILDDRDAGKNRRPRGEDLGKGEIALPAGTLLEAAQLGVLASIGCARVAVHRRPRVAIVGSGDELVDVDQFDEVLAGRRIVSSNSYALRALIHEAGGEAIDLGITPDDAAALRDRLAEAAGCDLLLTCAGVSMGDADHTRSVLEGLGGALDFWRVRIRPGAPLAFGQLHGMPWIGLPGNPVSAMVTFELFARPAIRRLAGHRAPFRRTLRVRVAEEIRTAAPLTHFLRARFEPGADGVTEARLTGPQGSGLLTSMARADGLLVVPADVRVVAADGWLDAIPLGDRSAHRSSFLA